MAKSKALKVVASQPQHQEVAPVSENPFLTYGNAVSSMGRIQGQLLKFNKGDWSAGMDNEELPEGTKLVANMDSLLIGWQRWEDGRPTEEVMGLVLEAFIAPKRHELSFNDQSEWEIDQNNGKPRDPWRWTNMMILKATDKSGQLYTFSTQSKGGINAVGVLCRQYGKEMREHPDQYPIVQLGVDSYRHSDPQFGKIKVPTFTITGWTKKEGFSESDEEAPITPTTRKKIR